MKVELQQKEIQMVDTKKLRKECNDIMNEKIVDFDALRADLKDVLTPDKELHMLKREIRDFVRR